MWPKPWDSAWLKRPESSPEFPNICDALLTRLECCCSFTSVSQMGYVLVNVVAVFETADNVGPLNLLDFHSNDNDHDDNCNCNYQQSLFTECASREITLRLVSTCCKSR